MKKIYITGVLGTGKSTIAKELEKRGLHVISIDAVKGLCCWRNKKTGKEMQYNFDGDKEWFENYGWTCDVEKLKELINIDEKIIIVTGIADNQNSYLDLFDKLFVLRCKPEIFLKRVIERKTDNLFGKSLQEREYLLGFYQDFEKDLLERGAVPVNAEMPIENVADKIIARIGGGKKAY